MPRRSRANRMRGWKMERASMTWKRYQRSQSNKYSGGDREPHPKAHARKQFWVGGYRKKDGTKVKGYVRTNPAYSAR